MTPRSLSHSMVLALCLLVGFGCASSTPAPEHPEGETEDFSSGSETTAEESPKPMPTAPSGGTDKGIPDDYTITEGDCSQLGNHFGEVTRDDKLKEVSPKLSDKQREQAVQNIVDVSTKVGEQWATSCSKSLVGKVGDPKSLKCALESRTVKDFDACINSDPKGDK